MKKGILINPFCFLHLLADKGGVETGVTLEDFRKAADAFLFTEVDFTDKTGIDWIYEALSHTPEGDEEHHQKVGLFEHVSFQMMDGMSNVHWGDGMYVDEEGLYNNVNDVWIVVRGAWQPFAGAGLVVGTTPSGDTTTPKNVDIDFLRRNTLILFREFMYRPASKELYGGPYRGAITRMVHYAEREKLYEVEHPIWSA